MTTNTKTALRTIADWPITDPANMDAVNMAEIARAALTTAAAVPPEGVVMVPVELAERVQESLGEFLMDHGWSQRDMDTSDDFGAVLLAAAPKEEPVPAGEYPPLPASYVGGTLLSAEPGITGCKVVLRFSNTDEAEVWFGALATRRAAPVAQGDALTDTYVQQVPDKCDRIVWRGRYYHLPIDAAEHSYTEPSPMAKVAAALRQKAEQEDAAYQARRSDQGLMESEWGPMEDAPPHEDPPMHVAVVEGDDTVRTLQWNRDVAAFAYPAGTLLYAARSQAKEGA